MDDIKIKASNDGEVLLAIHGSSTKGIDFLYPHVVPGGGVNGAMFGTGVYLTGTGSISTAKRYAGNEGSIYIAELDISNFITVAESEYLTPEQGIKLAGIVNELEPELKIRMATDLGGREFHAFVDLDEAELFYDEQKEQLKEIGRENGFTPISRCGVRVERNTADGKYVVSTARFELPLDWVSTLPNIADTDDISRSMNLFSNSFSTEVWSSLGNGLIIHPDGKSSMPTYLSFYSVPVKAELNANLDSEQIYSWCVDNVVNKKEDVQVEASYQEINYDKDISKLNSLFFVGKNGYISTDRYDKNIDDDLAEIYIEPRPKQKFYIDKISGSHDKVENILRTFAQNFPCLLNYSVRFDNNPPVTVGEMLANFDNNTIKEPNVVTLYHGTSTDYVGSIAVGGIMPRSDSGVSAHYYNERTGESLVDRVYLGDINSMGVVRAAALSAANATGGEPIILEVKLPISELETYGLPDEDSRKSTWKESLDTMGTLAFSSRVLPDYVDVAPKTLFNDSMSSLRYSVAEITFEDAKFDQKMAAGVVSEELSANDADIHKSESVVRVKI
ncbi:hypothetical protein [Photobacterium kishitanii]|uniref:Uncharacterized protein n=1 Tax=Photobacterium kishitanii TaxID=318456 RepID=A0A2T3KLQ1_9GAMM|nr:hypothetical protein [Photobacterium kishitanii]PSV00621.1 hypothetical protein C9J27_05650 [Photobacterium kishitanii]